MFELLFMTKAILLEITCTWLIPISADGLWAAFLYNHATGAYSEDYWRGGLWNVFLTRLTFFTLS